MDECSKITRQISLSHHWGSAISSVETSMTSEALRACGVDGDQFMGLKRRED